MTTGDVFGEAPGLRWALRRLVHTSGNLWSSPLWFRVGSWTWMWIASFTPLLKLCSSMSSILAPSRLVLWLCCKESWQTPIYVSGCDSLWNWERQLMSFLPIEVKSKFTLFSDYNENVHVLWLMVNLDFDIIVVFTKYVNKCFRGEGQVESNCWLCILLWLFINIH